MKVGGDIIVKASMQRKTNGYTKNGNENGVEISDTTEMKAHAREINRRI